MDLTALCHGTDPKCRLAFENLKKICENELKGNYSIEVIDLLVNPVWVTMIRSSLSTLVRKLPVPMRKIIGDLVGYSKELMHGLDIR